MKSIVSALTLGLVFVTPLLAETLSSEQDVLQRLQQLQENQQVLVEDYQQQHAEYLRKHEMAQKDAASAQKELEVYQDKLDALMAKNTDGSLDRQVKLAEHGLAMAARGVKNRLKRMQRISTKLASSVAKREQHTKQLLQTTAQVSRQEVALSVMRRQAQAQAQAREQEQEQEQAAARKISSRKLEVAEVENTKVRPLVKPSSNGEANTGLLVRERAQRVEQLPVRTRQTSASSSNKVLLASEVEAPVLSSATVSASSDKAAGPEVDQLALDAMAKSLAETEQARLNEALSAPSSQLRPLYKKLTIHSAQMDKARFAFLGNHQYRAESPVEPGRHLFSVGSHQYRGTVPNSDGGSVYVFLFDTSRKGKPRLSMFRKSLVQTEPVASR